jgi:hypothetical protein
MSKFLSSYKNLNFEHQTISGGLVAYRCDPAMATYLSAALDNIPITDLNDFLVDGQEVKGDVFLFLPRKKYYNLTNKSFDFMGLKQVEVSKRRINGMMMYMIIYSSSTHLNNLFAKFSTTM